MRKLITALVASHRHCRFPSRYGHSNDGNRGRKSAVSNKKLITCCQRRLLVRTVPMRVPWAGPECCARHRTRRRRGHWCSSKINCHSS